MYKMTVYYNDGETDIFDDIQFGPYDLEGLAVPVFSAIIFETKEREVFIPIDKVKKIEFDLIED